MKSSSWRYQAACRDADARLFFPGRKTAQTPVEIEAAKRLCGICPVQAECLEFALLTRQEFGIWGGTTESERRLMLKLVRARARSEELVGEPA
ncbi:MAG: WhiB family transcriptional regulator [Acidimicrobiia bacterium]|nr:WhiB family transcriptional regulator [Acidimicrobiia bacterium]